MSSLKKYAKLFFKFIYDHKFTILFLVFLCVISVRLSNTGIGNGVSKPAIINALSFFLVVNLLSKIGNNIVSGILTVILSFLISFDAYFAFIYHSAVSLGIMASIFETNMSEAKEALSLAGVDATIIFAATTVLLFFSKKELKDSKVPVKYTLIMLFAYWLLFIPFVVSKKLFINDKLRMDFYTHPVEISQKIIHVFFPLIYNDIATIVTYQYDMRQMKNFNTSERTLPEGIILNDTTQRPNKIIFVIGESSNRMHYSLYGYPIGTTPFMDSLKNMENSPLDFYNGLSPATFTREAGRIFLSFASPFDKHPFFENKNIIDLARGADYETIWISNQEIASTLQVIDYIGLISYIKLVASSADKTFYTETPNEDMNLLSYLKQDFVKNKKQFIVLHMVGSHKSYDTKYDEIDKAAIRGEDSKDGNGIIDYDRTIHHCDRVLREIYNIVKQDSAYAMLYISDHSEIVGIGHGLLHEGTDQFDIPFVTISNNPAPVDTIVKKYIDNHSGLINTSSSIYFMAELMGYSIPEELTKKAVSEGQYVLNADGNVYKFDEILHKRK